MVNITHFNSITLLLLDILVNVTHFNFITHFNSITLLSLDIIANVTHFNSITVCSWGEGQCCSCAVFGEKLFLKAVFQLIKMRMN